MIYTGVLRDVVSSAHCQEPMLYTGVLHHVISIVHKNQ
jgi:hypothetical protein